jgi:GT2 family glycosyltransferase
MQQPKVAIIILNWNGFNDTSECLDSLKSIYYSNYEVILVDNNSNGDDFRKLREKYSDFVKYFIKNDRNLGFAGGNNSGIRLALEKDFDYVLLLNNDTIVEPDFLDNLILSMNKNITADISAPKIIYHSNKIKASGFAYGFNEKIVTNNNERFCTFASGCCILIRSEVFKKIGLLDEAYFLYLEDTDFCFRATKNGFKILYTPTSKIYHKVGSTTTKDNNLLPLYYSIRNRLYFARKNLGYYYYLSLIYIIFTFLLKIIFSEQKLDKLKIFILAFKDFLNGKKGIKVFQ